MNRLWLPIVTYAGRMRIKNGEINQASCRRIVQLKQNWGLESLRLYWARSNYSKTDGRHEDAVVHDYRSFRAN